MRHRKGSKGSKGFKKSKDNFHSKKPQKILQGIVKRHPDGFGFFIADDADQVDVYIPRNFMSGVMANDRVEISMERESGGDRFRGEILEILQRATNQAAGQYTALPDGKGILKDKSFAWGSDLIVENPENIPVKDKDWVAVRLTDYPDSARGFRGVLVKVIGDILDPLNDSPRVLHLHRIPDEFSKKTIQEAARFGEEVDPRDIEGRVDLREMPLITIDGQTAKDFDDAILVQNQPTGFRLIVAIADVSHYVKLNTAIDEDAYERGTSTYFPNFVSPMLPKNLSDHLCSLKPNVDRLCLVADMTFDFQGEKTSSKFYEAVMRSHARVTYGQAQEVIDGSVPESLRHVADCILRASDLAKILMAKRFREGSLNLEIPQTEIEVDETGQPVDIMQAERIFSHRLIEEMMLAANVAVAEFLNQNERAVLFRIHEEPNPEAIMNLVNYLHTLGFQKTISGGDLQKKITKALQEFSGHPHEHILNVLTLRSMAQAKYSPHNVGHFGLGFANYAHFTSPIRRYPDLIVHRVLKSVICPGKGYGAYSMDELESAGTVLSAAEQRSVKAERHIQAIKKARFMSKHLGQVFEGFISSVTKFGLFVLLRQFDVDGLIRLEDLGGDRFEFDPEKLILVGRKSGMKYVIGDPLMIQVAAAHIDEGRVDFVLAPVEGAKPKSVRDRFLEESSSGPTEKLGFRSKKRENGKGGKRARQQTEKRGKAEDNSGHLRSSRFSKPTRKS